MAWLAERLLDVEFVGREIVPRYLTARDRCWAEELLLRLSACVGLRRPEVLERLARPGRAATRWPAYRALVHLLLELHGFAVRAARPPSELRAALFDAAAAAPPGSSRTDVLAATARSLGLGAEELEAQLYADLPEERVLLPLAEPLPVGELLERYNLALAQGLLLRSEALRVILQGNVKVVLRQARLQRLLCLTEAAPRGVRLHLSGPLALFHHTMKYGHAMAAWLPVLIHAPCWELSAVCVLRGARCHWRASDADPLGGPRSALPLYDSALEEQFARDFARHAPAWQVLREADPVQLGRRILCPDFTLLDEARGLRVPVEIVGFWTPEYLREKLRVLEEVDRQARVRPPPDPSRAVFTADPRPYAPGWLVCIDESLSARAELPPLDCFRFRRRINVPEFLAYLEGWLARRLPAVLRAQPLLARPAHPAHAAHNASFAAGLSECERGTEPDAALADEREPGDTLAPTPSALVLGSVLAPVEEEEHS